MKGKKLDIMARDLGLERKVRKFLFFTIRESDRSLKKRFNEMAIYLYLTKQKDR